MVTKDLIDERLSILKTRPFRAKFHLGPKEMAIIDEKGLPTMRQHAENLLRTRLFPAFPFKDGKQTPYRGHPVFVAQHASATCCRNCLQNWHKIPKGKELDAAERIYVLDVIETWLMGQLKK